MIKSFARIESLCLSSFDFTSRHLHQRVEEHKRATIGYHIKDEHDGDPDSIGSNFEILKKSQSKLDCLIFEMLFIRKLKPKLNKQSDSIRAKLFTQRFLIIHSCRNFFFSVCVCELFIFQSFSQYLISIFIIDCMYFKRIQNFLLFNLKMTVERSKRRCFLTLTFLVKSVSKNLLILINSAP